MRIPSEGKVKQIPQGSLATTGRDDARGDIAPEYVGDLNVEQMRRVQACAGREDPLFYLGPVGVCSSHSIKADASRTITALSLRPNCERGRKR